MKTTYSQDSLTPFGGIHFVYDLLSTHHVDGLINRHLGPRSANSHYRFSDIVYGLLSVFMCGGDCAEDIKEHVGPYLDSPRLRVCSPDSLLRVQQQWATPAVEYTTERGVHHQFNWNGPLARLNLAVLKRLGRLTAGQGYTLDYDNVILATEKADAAQTYRHHYGYQPGVGMIDDKIVYVENRNGNSEPMFQQYRTLRRMFGLLAGQSIHIERFRADSGSYVGDVVDLVAHRCDRFYIKARLGKSVMSQIAKITNWQSGREGAQWGSINYTPFRRSRGRRSNQTPQQFRLVVERIPREDGQTQLFSEGAYSYQAILTSDRASTAPEVFSFYRKRGSREREFDVLKNDFGWKRLPFSQLNQNTVYLFVTALIRNLYGFVIGALSEQLRYLQPQFRLKKFIFRFITVPAKWIHTGRQRWLKLYTQKMYPQ